MVDCIRVRKPGVTPKKPSKKSPPTSKPDFNDEVGY
jgi:hypothetical protein